MLDVQELIAVGRLICVGCCRLIAVGCCGLVTLCRFGRCGSVAISWSLYIGHYGKDDV